MGNLLTTHHDTNELTQEQSDLRYLGNNFPFGDSELKILYKAYNELQQCSNNNPYSDYDNNDTLLHLDPVRQAEFLYHLYRHCLIQTMLFQRKQQDQQQKQHIQYQKRQHQKSGQQKKKNHVEIINNSNNYNANPKWASQEEADIAVVEEIRRIVNDKIILMNILQQSILPNNFESNFYNSLVLPEPMQHAKQQQQQQDEKIVQNRKNQPNQTDTCDSNKCTKNNNNNTCHNIHNKNSVSTGDISTLTMPSMGVESNLNASITTCISSGTGIRMDEYTRKTLLESFFRALAVSSRRGSRAAVKAMFLICQSIEQNNDDDDDKISTDHDSQAPPPTFIPSTPTTPNDNHYTNETNNTAISSSRRIRAIELVDMGYRLALATAYLQHEDKYEEGDEDYEEEIVHQQQQQQQELPSEQISNLIENIIEEQESQDDDNKCDKNIEVTVATTADTTNTSSFTTIDNNAANIIDLKHREKYFPPSICCDTNNNNEYPFELKAFAKSLIERAKSRRQRSGNQYRGQDCNSNYNNDDDGTVELDDIFDWIENVAPLFASILPTFIQSIIFPNTTTTTTKRAAEAEGTFQNTNNNSSTRTSFIMPSVPKNSSDFFIQSNSPLLYTIGCLSSSLSSSTEPYYRLYASSVDGLSFNRLLNAILGYSGPTLFIIRAINNKKKTKNANDGGGDGDSVFGAFTNSPWKESKDFYGNTDCFLYQLVPFTAIYRPTGNNTNFMYCNSAARSRGYDQQAHGIGFGGTIHQPRLFIEETFENCAASSRDLTFDNGHLLPTNQNDDTNDMMFGSNQNNNSNSHFDIDSVEVWGVGTADVILAGLESRSKQRDVANDAIQRARKVDKAQFLDDLRSGLIDNKQFKHRGEIDGRAENDVDARYEQMKQNKAYIS